MIRRLVRGSWLALLGLALATLSAGCSDPNEAEFREGGPGKEGIADPKYAHGSERTYKQYYQDKTKEAASAAKGKAPRTRTKTTHTPAAPAPAPPASEAEKKE
jgi:hypothetical protein